jgi:hypothetical protein
MKAKESWGYSSKDYFSRNYIKLSGQIHALPPGKKPSISLHRNVPHSRTGRFGEEKFVSPVLETQLPLLGRAARSFVTTTSALSGLTVVKQV